MLNRLRHIHFTLLLAFFLGLTPVRAQQVAESPWPDNLFDVDGKGPRKEHDFGTVAHGTSVVHFFKMKNPFAVDVRIANVTSSCSCTSVYYSKDRLQPHETADILARFNADVNQFDKSATITVEFDEPYSATTSLTVKGYIRPDITFTPASINFGSIKEGEAASRSLELTYSGPNAAWRLIDVKSPVEYLSGNIIETKLGARPGQIVFKVRITASAKAPKGRFSERLLLVSSEGGRTGTIPVLVEGTVPGTIAVTPSPLFLGFLKPGQESVKSISLSADKKCTIKSVKCGEPAITVTLPKEGPAKFRHQVGIGIKIPEDVKAKKYQVKAEVETDDPELKTWFWIMAEVREAKEEGEEKSGE